MIGSLLLGSGVGYVSCKVSDDAWEILVFALVPCVAVVALEVVMQGTWGVVVFVLGPGSSEVIASRSSRWACELPSASGIIPSASGCIKGVNEFVM